MGAALLGLSVILGSCELRRDPGPGPLRTSGARRGLLLQPRAPCLPHWPLRGGGGDMDDYSDGAAALAAPAPAGHGSAAQREAGGPRVVQENGAALRAQEGAAGGREGVLRAYSEGRGGGGGGGGGGAVAREDLLDVGGRCASILAELGEPSRPAFPLPFPS
jgi:hypothetical protein